MNGITEKIEANGGVIAAKELNSHAEYQRVCRAVNRGELVRVRQGVYAEPATILNTMIDIERIVPRGVVCLYNAWAFYKLSTSVPPGFCIAIDAKRKVSLPGVVPIIFYYWKSENLEFGITEQEMSGCKVRMTDVERSVCDAIKYRNKIGMDVCTEVVKTYLKRKNRNLSRLTDYAKRLRVANTLNNYLEISLE